jgi:uncharacterized membrane protein YgcG
MNGAVRFAAPVLACVLALPAQAQERFPERLGRISDFADALDARAEERLQLLLDGLEKEAQAEIVLATVFHAGQRTPKELADALARQWDVGRRHEGRGLLLVLALKERSLGASVGSGLHRALPGSVLDGMVRGSTALHAEQGKFEAAFVDVIERSGQLLGQAQEAAAKLAAQRRRLAALDGDEWSGERESPYARDLRRVSWTLLLVAALGGLGFQLRYRYEELIPDRAFLIAGLGAAALPLFSVLVGAVSPLALWLGGGVALGSLALGLSLWDHRCPQCQLWMDISSEPAGRAAPGKTKKIYDCRFCGEQRVKYTALPAFRRSGPAAVQGRPKARRFVLSSDSPPLSGGLHEPSPGTGTSRSLKLSPTPGPVSGRRKKGGPGR